jgi:hypothetical protein
MVTHRKTGLCSPAGFHPPCPNAAWCANKLLALPPDQQKAAARVGEFHQWPKYVATVDTALRTWRTLTEPPRKHERVGGSMLTNSRDRELLPTDLLVSDTTHGYLYPALGKVH